MSENTEEKETGEVVNEAPTEQNAENAPSAEAKVAELNDKYLRLYSDFDNFRKRSIKEKSKEREPRTCAQTREKRRRKRERKSASVAIRQTTRESLT